MKNTFNHLILPTAASASMLIFTACGDDEDPESDKSDLLHGEWELVSVDGEPAGEEYDDYSYKITFEFQADGDFTFCYGYEFFDDPSQNYEDCYNGDWEWVDVGSKVTMDWDEEPYELEITKLTETELEGIMSETDGDEDESYEVVFEKL